MSFERNKSQGTTHKAHVTRVTNHDGHDEYCFRRDRRVVVVNYRVTLAGAPTPIAIFMFSNGTTRPCTGAIRAGFSLSRCTLSYSCIPYSGVRSGVRGSSPGGGL